MSRVLRGRNSFNDLLIRRNYLSTDAYITPAYNAKLKANQLLRLFYALHSMDITIALNAEVIQFNIHQGT